MPILSYAIIIIALTALKIIPSISLNGAAVPVLMHAVIFAILLVITLKRRNQQVRCLTEKIQPAIEKYSSQGGDMESLKKQLRPAGDKFAEDLLTSDGLTDLVMSSAFDALLNFFSKSEESHELKEMREQIHRMFTTIAETKHQFRMTLVWCLTISIIAIIVNL